MVPCRFDDVDDNIKCVFMENNTGVFSVDVDTGRSKHIADLDPQSASLELTGSAFDSATGNFYQLMLVGLFQVLYKVKEKTGSAIAVCTRTPWSTLIWAAVLSGSRHAAGFPGVMGGPSHCTFP